MVQNWLVNGENYNEKYFVYTQSTDKNCVSEEVKAIMS
jgi:hypothetical protein